MYNSQQYSLNLCPDNDDREYSLQCTLYSPCQCNQGFQRKGKISHVSPTISLCFSISFARKKCENFRFFREILIPSVRNFREIENAEISRKKIMLKFRAKNNAKKRPKISVKNKTKISRKKWKLSEKTQNFCKNTVASQSLWTNRQKLKRQLEKSNSLHQTFIKVMEQKLLIKLQIFRYQSKEFHKFF